MKNKLLEVLSNRVAEGAAGPSTLRGRGREGFVEEARTFLKQLRLSQYSGAASPRRFRAILDHDTHKLFLTFQEIKRNNLGTPCGENEEWGAARKTLNLFLRDVLYNRYLCQHFQFQAIEDWLEVPLDSYVAKGLRKCAPKLPSWAGLVRLTHEDSDRYQDKAASMASDCGFAPVHLDVLFWRALRKPCELCKRWKGCSRSTG
jgi:hypothetical protein